MPRPFRIASAAALGAALPCTYIGARTAQPVSKQVAKARVDSMVRAVISKTPAASVSVLIIRGNDVLV